MKIKLLLTGVVFLFLNIFAFATIDLVVYNRISGPDIANEGDLVTFSSAIKSVGGPATNVRVRGGIIMRHTAHYLYVYEKIFPSVPADTDMPVSFTWRAEIPSGLTVEAVLMEVFSIDIPLDEELEETNNFAEKPFEVRPRPLPDLTLTVTPKTIKTISYKAGDKMKFQIKIENRESANAKNCRLHIKHDSVLASDMEIPPLAGHTSKTIDYTFPVKCNERITIIADALNQIKEFNESNNEWSKIMICNPRTVHPMTPAYITTGKKK